MEYSKRLRKVETPRHVPPAPPLPATPRHLPKSRVYIYSYPPPSQVEPLAPRWRRCGGPAPDHGLVHSRTAKIKPAEASPSANRKTWVRLPPKRVQKHLSARVRTAKDAHTSVDIGRGSRTSSEFGDPRERRLFCWVQRTWGRRGECFCIASRRHGGEAMASLQALTNYRFDGGGGNAAISGSAHLRSHCPIQLSRRVATDTERSRDRLNKHRFNYSTE
ncbi:hypothetical protein KVT40_005316 [Elsinoe batatas]|uniref:Uncharacterized protein n=1 Tax=Elsinoe batatas TaxID=2601811 RepID=A0A8K0PE43_9PEZI|nr:hypothetical protein KVT40_005316 [Elsinoe batatas]